METETLIPRGKIKQEPDYDVAEGEETTTPSLVEEIKHKTDDNDDGPVVKKELNEDDESDMSPVIKHARTSFMSSSCPDEDNFMYCEKCQLKYEGGCTKHGPIIYIDNAEAAGQGEGCSQDASSTGVQVAGNKRTHVPGWQKVEQPDVHEEVHYCVQGYLPVSQVEYLQVMPGDRYFKLDMQDHLLDVLPKEKIKVESVDSLADTSSGDGHSETSVSEDETSVDFVGHEGRRPDTGKAHSDDVGTLPHRDCSTESDQMFSVCEMSTELCVAGTSCGSQSNVELKPKQKIQNTGKPFTCDVCGAGFSENSGLNRHGRVHTGEKPYKCDVCGVGFAWASGLKSHSRIHTGEKPYKCDVCGFEFSSCSNLKTHRKTHTGEKPFTCDVCKVGFTRQGDLNRHKRTHTGEKPFKCDICLLEFTACGDLTKHTRVHTGEKPYKCEVCGVGFSRCCSLNRHKRIHTGEKPYKCDVCGAEFARCSDLTRHKKIHSADRQVKGDAAAVEHAGSSSSSGEEDQPSTQPSAS